MIRLNYRIKLFVMKGIIIILLLVYARSSSAQFLGGFFSQKKTQVKYLKEQIIALKAYEGYLEKGYGIVKDGTTFIGDLKNGEFDLHKKYFTSLATISPVVARSAKVKAIYKMQADISSGIYKVSPLLASLPPRTSAQMRSVLSELSNRASLELDELILILENNGIDMTEDARLQAIDRIYQKVTALYGTQKRLLKGIVSLASDLSDQQRDNALRRKLF